MPQHNGVAKSLNRCLLERVRTMLHQAELPKNLWAEAINFTVWLKNRTSTKALGNVTPYEQLYGQKPNLGNMPEWGQHVWVHNSVGRSSTREPPKCDGWASMPIAHTLIEFTGRTLGAYPLSATSSSCQLPILYTHYHPVMHRQLRRLMRNLLLLWQLHSLHL